MGLNNRYAPQAPGLHVFSLSLLVAATVWPVGLARLAGLSVILAQGALFLVLRRALAACRAHEAKLAALPPVPEAS